MSVYWVVLCYGAAVAVALLLLYLFEPIHWIWHVLSICIAVGIGLMSLPPALSTPGGTMLVGAGFLLLFSWGILAPLFRQFHRHSH